MLSFIRVRDYSPRRPCYRWAMPVTAAEIEARIVKAMPDARVAVTDTTGTSDHWAATVVSAAFTGKTLRAVQNDQTRYFEDHPDELKRFPEQIFAAMQGGWMHLGGDEATPGVDPERECYPAGQGVGALHELVPASELVAAPSLDVALAQRR